MNEISAQMRADIFDWLALSPYHWSGTEDEDDFLSRIYDLSALPSTDSRPQFRTAAEDIWQHRVRNHDWDSNWVFGDTRFNLRHVEDEEFLRFLVDTVNPTVRRDPSAASTMVASYNGVLRTSGYELVQDRKVGDSVYYRARTTLTGINSPGEVQVIQLDTTNSTVLHTQLRRLKRDIDTDPSAAIAHCKELIESQCKIVLTALGQSYGGGDELPKLYRSASVALGIHADSVPGNARASEAVKGVMRSLSAVVQSVAEARNAMGTGHGGESESPATRAHARLIFNATVAITEFIADTWVTR
ncbi:abortive infection family protein [Microbacterium sp. NPDC057658]|uniref:abortive infection family protein n=1 Tax=unclassified Microbacterium TaxID=2609290 RepID=UPI00366BB3A8